MHMKIQIHCVLCVISVNLSGEMKEDEKHEGGCGPPIWSKCVVTYSDTGHFSGSDSWYSDPLTRL